MVSQYFANFFVAQTRAVKRAAKLCFHSLPGATRTETGVPLGAAARDAPQSSARDALLGQGAFKDAPKRGEGGGEGAGARGGPSVLDPLVMLLPVPHQLMLTLDFAECKDIM